MLYTRPQVRLLVGLAATLLVGLGVREWRAGFPELADRLERFDREDAAIAGAPPACRPARSDADGEPERAAGPGATAGASDRSEPAPRGGAARGPDEPPALEPSPPAGPVDLNQAGVAALAQLPGVGPSLARRIVQERERGGPFDSPDALRRVYGLGPRKLALVRPLVGVTLAPAAASAGAAGDRDEPAATAGPEVVPRDVPDGAFAPASGAGATAAASTDASAERAGTPPVPSPSTARHRPHPHHMVPDDDADEEASPGTAVTGEPAGVGLDTLDSTADAPDADRRGAPGRSH